MQMKANNNDGELKQIYDQESQELMPFNWYLSI